MNCKEKYVLLHQKRYNNEKLKNIDDDKINEILNAYADAGSVSGWLCSNRD